ncbi:MAG TPA: glycosyltransferase family 39 protein [Fimbriimonadales bacterium]|nr:glycosyltransferase family 39 protein [Fimbriimonadales bacterium]
MNVRMRREAPSKSKIPLLLIFALYIVLALGFIQVTPYRTAGYLPYQGYQKDIGAPDERQHVNYIRTLAHVRRFPVFGEGEGYETYESHQPPLYYLLCAPLSAIVGTENLALEMWTLRSVNVVLGLFVVALMFKVVKGFTNDEGVALFCAGFVALLPMFLALSAAVNNDILLYLIGLWSFAIIVEAWNKGWNTKRASWLGLSLGLGLLTKTSALVYWIPVLASMILWKSYRAQLRYIILTFALALLIASPWLIRNYLLYGDPLAIRIFQEAFHTYPASKAIADSGFWGYWLEWVALRALWSFWGVFSYFEINMEMWVYWLLSIPAALGILGFLVRIFTKNSVFTKNPMERSFHCLNFILFVIVLYTFIQFNTVYYQAQARYLFPALIFFVSIVGFGFRTISDGLSKLISESRVWFSGLAGGFLFLLFVADMYCLLWLLPIGFYRITHPEELQSIKYSTDT